MTVKALIAQLQDLDENLPVFVRTGRLVYEEVEYAEAEVLRKCSYSPRFHVPTVLESEDSDRKGVIISLNSKEWTGA